MDTNGLTSAELYDPASGIWTATGSLATRRWNHTSTLLANGTVLVAGGRQDYPITDAELYDPATGHWTPTGSLIEGRCSHTATLLPSGKVLVAGGAVDDSLLWLGPVETAELYDPATGVWTRTGSLHTARYGHTATLLRNGKVLVAGGFSYTDPYSAELYDPATGSWTITGELISGHGGHSATLLSDGKVLVVGGDWAPSIAELYDPASGTWTSTGSLVNKRSEHTATLLPDGKVLVAGGHDHDGVTYFIGPAELYDPASGTWSLTGSLDNAREDHTATLLPSGKVLVAGGAVFGLPTSAELYTEAPKAPALLNISTRVLTQTGDNAMIGGFIITGIDPKTVIIRGIGPSLAVPGALSDPVIEVHDSSGELLVANDNWNDATSRQQIIDSGLAPTNDLESALWGTINPGAYTVVVRGNNGGTGVGLFEVYDLDSGAASRLANVSTRGFVQTGDDVLIGGFISGAGAEGGTTTLLIRAIGPSIPVPDALADPTLELRDGNGVLKYSNDNWKVRSDGSSQQAEIEATTIPPTNDLESAILITVGPESYTAIVRGKDGTSGLALVEVYRLY